MAIEELNNLWLLYTLTLRRNAFKLFLNSRKFSILQILILCQGVHRDIVCSKMATEIDFDVSNKAKTVMVEDYNNHHLVSNYSCYSKAI